MNIFLMIMKISICGAGASGLFASIRCKQINRNADVTVFEKSDQVLSKVSVSGGGRCNLTNNIDDPKALAMNYPRGKKELISPFYRFGTMDTIRWFTKKGVPLKTEDNGRVFPVSDSSSSIVDLLINETKRLGVKIKKQCGIKHAFTSSSGFDLELSDNTFYHCDRLLIAAGGEIESEGIGISRHLGHSIQKQIPSLFSFSLYDHPVKELAGVSVKDIIISVPEIRLSQRGAILITHQGFSGPSVLSLSSLAARKLYERDYSFKCTINWCPGVSSEKLRESISCMRKQSATAIVHNTPIVTIPSRLWRALAGMSGCDSSMTWASFTKKQEFSLLNKLFSSEFNVKGKAANKSEFVTCGGVKLSEISLKTMKSKICPGLFFSGEILDIDGLTGGFNLQAAWTTGYIAGESMAHDKD